MKKTTSLVLAMALTAMASQAMAGESKLLPTDVLSMKQAAVRYDLGYTLEKATKSNFSLGYGIGYGVEVNASLPYTHNDADKKSGFGDMGFGVKYQALTEAQFPVNVTVGLDTTLDTGSKAMGIDGYSFTPSVAVSKTMGKFSPYASYAATFFTNDVADVHAFTVGSQYHPCTDVEFDVKATTDLFAKQGAEKSYEDVTVEGGVNVKIGKDLYLLPAVSYKFADVGEDTTGKESGYAASIGVKYLF